MARLIDADAVIDEWNKIIKRMVRDSDGKVPVDFGLVICELSKAPTVDAVEVVRCKDCKWYEENTEARTRFCRRELGYMYATPDGFCSYVERKDND